MLGRSVGGGTGRAAEGGACWGELDSLTYGTPPWSWTVGSCPAVTGPSGATPCLPASRSSAPSFQVELILSGTLLLSRLPPPRLSAPPYLPYLPTDLT